jgi:hypothetical protein
MLAISAAHSATTNLIADRRDEDGGDSESADGIGRISEWFAASTAGIPARSRPQVQPATVW